MRGSVRRKMVEGASEVLARRGLQATAFSEVLSLTGTSRGSIYHHFPGGKAELIEAVLEDHGARTEDELRTLHGLTAVAVVRGALDVWRNRLLRVDCEAGCPVAAVTIAADSARLEADSRRVFERWHETLVAALQASGVAEARARDFSMLVIASVQGGILLARAERKIGPYDVVAEQITRQAVQLRD